MNISITVNERWIGHARALWARMSPERWVALLAGVLAVIATAYSFRHGYIIAYGDAESHLNIAKRVVDSLTPGFAQLGGIWLPLPHVLLVPFVYFNPLWRTGLAGSIVSGVCFVVASVYLYKLTYLVTESRLASVIGALVFMLNPNILYMQSTPMSELTLLVFFILSSYYFIRHLQNQSDTLALVLAAAFGFCAGLSRYDGWFLVMAEAAVLTVANFPWRGSLWHWRWDRERYDAMEGRVILFATMAFFSIALWLAWGWLILGDPLYFTDSNYSAASQQLSWAARGELPAKHHVLTAFIYYFVTAMSNAGVLMFAIAIFGLVFYLAKKDGQHRWLIAGILLAPFAFNVISLYLGQSVIFIPSLTPYTFDWTLFNVRYGLMVVPAVAVFCGYLFYRARSMAGKLLFVALIVGQIGMYAVGYSQVITLQDGVEGLSSEIHKVPDAQNWMDVHYDGGMVLQDDFARTISIIKSPIPMKEVIYVGNKPYYAQSLIEPERYATWIVMQKNDEIWTHLYDDPGMRGRLYTYFQKVYTSPEILIFKRNPAIAAPVEPADGGAAQKSS